MLHEPNAENVRKQVAKQAFDERGSASEDLACNDDDDLEGDEPP
jgi:hypothetical protein